MKREIIRFCAFLLLAILLFTAGYTFGQSQFAPVHLPLRALATPNEAEQAFQPFWETWRFLHAEYFDQPLDDNILAEGAIEGMLAKLGDANTRYLSPENEQASRQSFQGNIEGIGAEVTNMDGAIVIVAPYEGSPAEAAGLRQGDILREANGITLTGMDVTEAAALVRGPSGTIVHLIVERDGELIEMEVMRGVISIPSVRGEILEKDIAYLRLSRFNNNSADEMADILDELMAQDPNGLILDLRSNPGGSLTTAVDVADHFLGDGTILLERFGNGTEKLFEARDNGLAESIPLVVLVDQGSASASEVLAGAIRDRERGILLGDTTFGKGTVQTWKGLSNGGGVRITIARWLTPEGTWVHGEGLVPDLVVPLHDVTSEDSTETSAEAFTDDQLKAAIDYLLEQSLLES